jgi:hypothetical protein
MTFRESLIGQKFGRLTVVGLATREKFIICECECGNRKEIRATNLTKTLKPTRSCGCLQREFARELGKRTGPVNGKKFGRKKMPPKPKVEKLPVNNTTGCKGVSYHKQIKKYHAYITINRKRFSLGTYRYFEDAVAARKEGEKKYLPLAQKTKASC